MLSKIKELRKLQKISQSDLACALDVTQTTISKWENCERIPDAETVGRLANYFDVSTDYLLGRQVNSSVYSSNVCFSEKELEILDLYRKLDNLSKSELLGFMKGLLVQEAMESHRN